MPFETVRIVHPKIPGSEHDVPKESLSIRMHAGWQIWVPPKEDEVPTENEATTDKAVDNKAEATEEPKKSTGGQKSANKGTSKE